MSLGKKLPLINFEIDREINFEILDVKEEVKFFKNPRRTDWDGFKTHLTILLEQMAWNAYMTTSAELDVQVEKLTYAIHEAFM